MPRLLIALALALSVVFASACTFQHPDPKDTSVEIGDVVRAERPVPQRIRVVTFNVKYRSASKLIHAFERDEVLRRADVVMLQEMESHPAERRSRANQLAAALNMSYAYAPAYGLSNGGSHGLAILSRYPIVDPQVIELPRYNVRVNSGRTIALSALVRVGGRSLRVYNVHLTNRINPGQRLRQMRPVAVRAEADTTHEVVVAGDFNTSWFRWGAHLFPVPGARQPRMLDRYMKARGFATPMAERASTSAWLDMRLDSMYTRGLRVTGKGVRKAVTISDHYPLWIDLEWPPSNEISSPMRVGQRSNP